MLEIWTNTSYWIVSNQTSFLPYKDQHSAGWRVCRDPPPTHMKTLLPLLVIHMNQFWKLTNPITILLQESHWLRPSFPLDRIMSKYWASHVSHPLCCSNIHYCLFILTMAWVTLQVLYEYELLCAPNNPGFQVPFSPVLIDGEAKMWRAWENCPHYITDWIWFPTMQHKVLLSSSKYLSINLLI